MSRIPALDAATATGHVKDLLDGVNKGLGVTPNLFRVAAQSPATLDALVGMFGALSKGKVDAQGREAIALTVSEFDGCDYCLSAHTALGRRAGLGEADLARARDATAEDPKLAAMLRFARLVATERGHVAALDLTAVRSAGATDVEILEIVANVVLTIFTNYLNEVAATDIDFPVVAHARR